MKKPRKRRGSDTAEPKKKRGIKHGWWDLVLQQLTARGLELVTAYPNASHEPRRVREKIRETAARYLTEFEPAFAGKIPAGLVVALKYNGKGPVQYGFKDGPEVRKQKVQERKLKNKSSNPMLQPSMPSNVIQIKPPLVISATAPIKPPLPTIRPTLLLKTNAPAATAPMEKSVRITVFRPAPSLPLIAVQRERQKPPQLKFADGRMMP